MDLSRVVSEVATATRRSSLLRTLMLVDGNYLQSELCVVLDSESDQMIITHHKKARGLEVTRTFRNVELELQSLVRCVDIYIPKSPQEAGACSRSICSDYHRGHRPRMLKEFGPVATISPADDGMHTHGLVSVFRSGFLVDLALMHVHMYNV